MFAIIDTKGATHIAIHVPLEGADKSLPALAGMLERNSTFIKEGYQTLETVAPGISFILGDTVRHTNYCEMIVTIPPGDQVVGPDFVLADASVFVSNQKAKETADKEISRLRAELSGTKAQLQGLQETIAELSGTKAQLQGLQETIAASF